MIPNQEKEVKERLDESIGAFAEDARAFRMWFFAIIIGLALSAMTPGASAQRKVGNDTNRKPRLLDCSKIYSPGCQSFNELLEAQDKDIVTAVTGDEKAARVCFIEGEDNFVIIAFDLPLESLWRKDKDGIGYQRRIAKTGNGSVYPPQGVPETGLSSAHPVKEGRG
jgi:hypothetical protein